MAKDPRNAYLLRNYGIDQDDEARILQKQDYRCAVCERPFFDENNVQICRYEIDHEHLKFEARRTNTPAKGWFAGVLGQPQVYWGSTKEKALKVAKRASLRGSVRGALCGGRYAGCNRKLGRLDSVEWLSGALAYIKDPPARFILINKEKVA